MRIITNESFVRLCFETPFLTFNRYTHTFDISNVDYYVSLFLTCFKSNLKTKTVLFFIYSKTKRIYSIVFVVLLFYIMFVFSFSDFYMSILQYKERNHLFYRNHFNKKKKTKRNKINRNYLGQYISIYKFTCAST